MVVAREGERDVEGVGRMMELSVIQRECSAEFGVATLDLIFRYLMLNRSLLGMIELPKGRQLDGKILMKPSIRISKIANYPFRATWKRFRFRSRSSGSISATFGD